MRCSNPTMLLRTLLLTAAFAAIGAAPAAALPQLNPLKPCYVAAQQEQREFVVVDGFSFTPFAFVDILVDDTVQPKSDPNDPEPQAAYDGTLKGSVKAPFIESGQRQFTLRVTERANADNTASATAKVTRLSVEQVPAKASTRDRVRFRGRGFTMRLPTPVPGVTTPAPVYAHYVFAGKSRKTVRIGTPTGDCGLVSSKRRQFPFKKSPQVGVWTIQFDQEPVYNPKAQIRVPLTIRVKRMIKPQRARAH
jgi:hypothetical protein